MQREQGRNAFSDGLSACRNERLLASLIVSLLQEASRVRISVSPEVYLPPLCSVEVVVGVGVGVGVVVVVGVGVGVVVGVVVVVGVEVEVGVVVVVGVEVEVGVVVAMSRPQRAPGTAQPTYGRQRAPIHSSKNAKHQADFRERMKLGKQNASLAQQLEAARQQVTEALKARQGDTAVQLYRREREAAKARLSAKERERWQEITQIWTRQKERDAEARKGGRPKGLSLNIARRNFDL